MGDLDPKHCRNSIKDEKKAFKLALKKGSCSTSDYKLDSSSDL